MKNIVLKEDDIIKLVNNLISEQTSQIKYGMKDTDRNGKISNLQKLLNLKTSSGNPIVTGYFGDMTAKGLMTKVPDIYKSKNDVIDNNKYNQIVSKLRQQSTQTKTNSTPTIKPKLTNNIIKSIKFSNLWNNFPKNSYGTDIFPKILPKQYKIAPKEFGNACATRLSLALNNLGIKPDSQFRTDNEFTWNGIKYKKGIPLTVTASATPKYLIRYFGQPSYDGPNNWDYINKYIKGKKAIFVLTKVPGWRATGHADILDSTKNFVCGSSCHFGEGGRLQAWFLT